MPTLNWIGKEAVVNHHKQVPFRLLDCDPALSAGEPDGNLLVQLGKAQLIVKGAFDFFAAHLYAVQIDHSCFQVLVPH